MICIIFVLDDDNHTNNAFPFAPNLCVECLAEPSTHAIVPCGHKCLCKNCHVERCPICQEKIIMIIQILN